MEHRLKGQPATVRGPEAVGRPALRRPPARPPDGVLRRVRGAGAAAHLDQGRPGGAGVGNLAGESTPDDLLTLARRHPRVRFFGGHIGGDWEWGIAALKQVDNVWLDIAGGDATGGYMETALARSARGGSSTARTSPDAP